MSVDFSKRTKLTLRSDRSKYPTDLEYDYAMSVTVDGEPHVIAEFFGRSAARTVHNAEANCAFAIHAWNCHDALVEAVEALLAMKDTAKPTKLAEAKARAIIAKAKGETPCA
jgi:hypothetical protein